jgi:hypothetical protein
MAPHGGEKACAMIGASSSTSKTVIACEARWSFNSVIKHAPVSFAASRNPGQALHDSHIHGVMA